MRYEKDYYRVLGLTPEAAEEEIRRAYRRLALQWHPDRNRGDAKAEERFKEISEAYAVLIDPAKRGEYDRARQLGAPEGFRQSREEIFRDLFADPRASAIFDELAREFGRMGMRVDRQVFHQTLFGGRTVITGGVFIITPLTPVLAMLRLARAALRGARAAREVGGPEPAAVPPPRRILDRARRAGRWLLGLPPAAGAPAITEPADADITYPLALTRAEAAQGARKKLTLKRDGKLDEVLVTIPPGVRPGTRLRLRGKGRATPGAPPGDLYLAIEVEG